MDRFRELLGPDCELSEAEVRELRLQIHELAEIIVDAASVTLASTASEIAEPTQSDKVEHHGNEIDGLDVEAVLEFAEHVVLNARRLWEEFPLDLRRRMQKVLFPEGLVWSNEAFRTPVTCLFFRDLERPEIELEKVVARTGFEPVLPA